MIHDSRGDDESIATMDTALSLKTVERYGREGGWPVLFFDDGASVKFVSNEIELIAIFRQPDEHPDVVYRRFRSGSEHQSAPQEGEPGLDQ